MASIERLQTSDCATPIIDIFFRLGGTLIDVSILEFQIFERVTSPPALVQVFPVSVGARALVDLADCPAGDKLGTGHYVAEWTVPGGEPIGAHTIKWFYKQTPSSPEREFCEEFQVTDVIIPGAGTGYCDIADLRAEGVPVSVISDVDLQAAIDRATTMVDFYTGQWFAPRSRTFTLDGRNAPTMFLGIPIISITSLTVDDLGLLPDEYVIYNRHLTENLVNPDDRENPRVELEQPREGTILYRQTSGRRLFPRGERNVELVGEFGYTDYDGTATGTTPPLICHVTKLLVMREMWRMFDQSDDRDDAARRRWITKLKTRDQEIGYSAPTGGNMGRQGVGPFTGDPEIDTILMQYRRPIHIGSTGGSNV